MSPRMENYLAAENSNKTPKQNKSVAKSAANILLT